ncbi:MAG: cell division protein ZapB [Spirochaetales bacterium]
MVTLEQIKKLEAKVSQAVATILELREENSLLRQKLETYQSKIDQLELLIAQYRDSQKEIEEGIVNALRQLDHLEDDALSTSSPVPNSPTIVSPAVEEEDIEGKPVIPDRDSEEESEEARKEGELDIF